MRGKNVVAFQLDYKDILLDGGRGVKDNSVQLNDRVKQLEQLMMKQKEAETGLFIAITGA